MRDPAAVCDPEPKRPDPVNPNTNNLRSPKGYAGQALHGTQASGSQMRRGKLTRDILT